MIVAADLPPRCERAASSSTRIKASVTPSLGTPMVAVAHAPLPTIAVRRRPRHDRHAAPVVTKPVARSLRDLEKDGILAALAATNGNKAQAAAILEIDRSTLYKKLKDYGIET